MSRRHTLAVFPLALLVAALAGCTPSASIPPPDPTPVTEPLFATDDEALEAATAAYEEYLAASNVVTSSPELSLDPIEDLVTSEYLENERPALQAFVDGGFRSSGSTKVASVQLQQVFEDEPGLSTVVIYVCLDVSGVRLIDNAGVDVTPVDRKDVVGLEVELVAVDAEPAALLVAKSQEWAGSELCG